MLYITWAWEYLIRQWIAGDDEHNLMGFQFWLFITDQMFLPDISALMWRECLENYMSSKYPENLITVVNDTS